MGMVLSRPFERQRVWRPRRPPAPWIGLVFSLCLAAAGAPPAAWAQEAPPAADVDEDEESAPPATPSKGSWLPIPIFITEPAIGIGLGAALAWGPEDTVGYIQVGHAW
jgi:hypothetical protein